jgi:pimeloyl-ACP methyl ester carboxylesterase
MIEHAILFGKDRSLVGVLTEDGADNIPEKNNLPGVLLLSSGLDHHVGPNRIYVKLARRLSTMGFVVLRFGFSGIADSGPRRDKLPAAESVIDETRQAMDELNRLKGLKRFILAGLCRGASIAFRVAASDPRVKGAILIDIGAPEDIPFRLSSWLRLIFFRSAYRAIWKRVKYRFKTWRWPSEFKLTDHSELANTLIPLFKSIREREVHLFMLDSAEEIGIGYLEEFMRNEYDELKNSGLLTDEMLCNTDHAITPLACQERFIYSTSSWLAEKFRQDTAIS